jgi:hypothetical protein
VFLALKPTAVQEVTIMTDGRTLGPALAQVVEELELDQPVVVTLDDLADILRRRRIRTRPVEVARRLRDRGWLLETTQRGVFEFAPGAHAGPHGHGDPFVDLRAYLANEPQRAATTRAVVCLQSAVWLRGFSDRAPNTHELAVSPSVRVPKALSSAFRVVRFDAGLEPEMLEGIPVQRPASLLLHLVSRPSDVRSWTVFVDALPDLVAGTSAEELAAETRSRSSSTRARLGYLLEGQDTAHLHLSDLGVVRPTGTIWFGPRDRKVHYDARWNIADTVLKTTAAAAPRSP